MPDDDAEAEARTIVIAGPHTERAVSMAGTVVVGLNLAHLVVVWDVEDGCYYEPRP